MIISLQKLVKFCAFILEILSKKNFFPLLKGRTPVENLHTMMFYNPYLDLVHDDVYTNLLVKFCPFIFKILCKTQFLTSIKGCCKFGEMMHCNTNVDLVNDNM